MAANRFIPPQAGESAQAFADVAQAIDDRTLLGSYPLSFSASLTVPVGAFQRVAPRATGMQLTIPAADSSNFGQSVTLFVERGLGTLRIRSASGTVNGTTAVSYGAGTYVVVLTSNGKGAWAAAGGPGNWAQVLAAGANSGANNPIVDVGQFLQFGLVGPTAGNPQIRSGDAVFRLRVTNALSLVAETGSASLSATLGSTSVTSGAALAISAGTNLVINTGGATRVIVDASGEWTTPAGVLGDVLTHQGAGTPPVWAAGGGGGGGLAEGLIKTLAMWGV